MRLDERNEVLVALRANSVTGLGTFSYTAN
jgi:hypothetical protein